jgi:hypothetical protein
VGVRVEVEVVSRFAAFARDLGPRLVHGENLAAERGVAVSVDLSPWDVGTLAGAHMVEPAVDPDDGAAVVVDTPYAARLHEHPEYNFSTDANPNAQGKWVETAIIEHADELGAIIAKEFNDG